MGHTGTPCRKEDCLQKKKGVVMQRNNKSSIGGGEVRGRTDTGGITELGPNWESLASNGDKD